MRAGGGEAENDGGDDGEFGHFDDYTANERLVEAATRDCLRLTLMDVVAQRKHATSIPPPLS